MHKPATVFKFESFSTQSLINLKSQTIFFGSPKNFNDPYDCALTAKINTPSDAEVEKFIEIECSKSSTPVEIKNQFYTKDKKAIKDIIKSAAEKSLSAQIESFKSNYGVSCFTECNKDLLMWAHYGGRYKGFCLEFSTDFEPLTKIRKVKYQEKMPEIDIISMITGSDNAEQILDLFCTKSKSWEYEKEWRSIHKNANTAFTYQSEALKAVYFGPEIDFEAIEIICLILQGQNPHIEFWKGRRSNDLFEVEFEKFEYINHINSMKKIGYGMRK